MEATGSVFSETLHKITSTKLRELAKRRAEFEKSKAAAVSSAQEASDDPILHVEAFSKGVKRCFGLEYDDGGAAADSLRTKTLRAELGNIDRFLAQARYDPSISIEMILRWRGLLERYLETQSLKYEFADLYGKLVTEWLEVDRASIKAQASAQDDFDDVGSAARLKARMEWEENVFTPAGVDEAALGNFLSQLFCVDAPEESPKSKVKTALTELRQFVERRASSIASDTAFDIATLQDTISSLVSLGFLSDEKRETLVDFRGNTTILKEIADVLNMRLASLNSWTWGEAVLVEQRRLISGRYNITMQDDLLDAIFLHYIGQQWSLVFKQAFAEFYDFEHGAAWPRMGAEIPPGRKSRLVDCLGNLDEATCLHRRRQVLFRNNYFVCQLAPTKAEMAGNIKEGEEEAEYSVNLAAAPPPAPNNVPTSGGFPGMAKRTSSAYGAGQAFGHASSGLFDAAMPIVQPSSQRAPTARRFRKRGVYNPYTNEFGNKYSISHVPMHLKQSLLHILSTDVAIETATKGEVGVFHSVFKEWNQLLPHETVLAVLEFMGVPRIWLNLFSRFLRAPLRFEDDDSTTEARERRRGTPAAHKLSDLFGEVVLFCLDFSVNQATKGQALWRIRDDIWFWSSDNKAVVEAWKAVAAFAEATGTLADPQKSGSVRISGHMDEGVRRSLEVDACLPRGEIRWGFLRLNPCSARFEIDQEMVKQHISELRKQLDEKTGSILGFIQAWNSYAGTFFSSNFGKSADCFGRAHVDEMLATHQHVQREVFGAASGPDNMPIATSVVDYLKKTIQQRFDVSNIPDGYLFFPAELGGLDLESPFVTLQQIRDSTLESPSTLLDKMFESERRAYSYAKEQYELNPYVYTNSGEEKRKAPFISFEEYIEYRDAFNYYPGHAAKPLYTVCDVFDALRNQPVPRPIEGEQQKYGAIGLALSELNNNNNGSPGSSKIKDPWSSMTPYWQWVTMMYGPEIVERFGGLSLVDPGLLPMGMVSIFRGKRVKWSG